MNKVAGDKRKSRLFYNVKRALHAVVKFVVAKNGKVVSNGVHKLYDIGALVHRAVNRSLYKVARVNERDVFSLRGKVLL